MSIFSSLASAIVSAASFPVCAVADAVTLGGVLTDRNTPYTAEAASNLMRNIKAASDQTEE